MLREGKRVELKVTYQERGGGGGQSPHGQATATPEQQGRAKPSHP